MLYQWIFQVTSVVACAAVVVTVIDAVQRACADADPDQQFDHAPSDFIGWRQVRGPAPAQAWVDEPALWGPPELGNDAAIEALTDAAYAIDTLTATRLRLDALEAT